MPGAPRKNPAAPRGAQADLATRLRHGADALQERFDRLDTFVELIRSVNQTLEPRKVADALLAHAPRDQLGDLAAEIQNQHAHLLLRAVVSGCSRLRSDSAFLAAASAGSMSSAAL